jgi:hypothetical protein
VRGCLEASLKKKEKKGKEKKVNKPNRKRWNKNTLEVKKQKNEQTSK